LSGARIALPLCLVTCAWLGAGALVVAAQPKYVPVVKSVKKADLAKAKTYAWMQRHPAFDERVDARIVAAIDRELESRGLTKLASGSPDMVVAYGSLTRTDIDLKAKTSDGVSREYAVGTLVVELSDATTRQPLFKVQIDTPIERDPAALDAVIDTAVKALFEKYPAQSQPAQSQPGSQKTLVEARKYLEGRWGLQSFEVRPAGAAPIVVAGSGALTFDDFANLRMEIRTDQAASDLLRAAGIEVRDGVISSDGRVAIDLQRRTLTYFIEGQRSSYVTGGGPLALNRPRHWEVTADTLTLTTRDESGAPLSISRWMRLR
jgi:hypothetical protein